MKTRNGFVSNSSSSSFIIEPNSQIPNVFSLGKAMLKIRNEDWDGDAEINIVEEQKLDKAIELGLNQNMSICFKTTNYETFLRLNSYGKIEVNTSNNHDWTEIENTVRIMYVDDELDEEDIFELPRKTVYFWWLREGLVGKPVTNEEWSEFITSNSIDKDKRWPECWRSEKHFTGIVRTIENKIECVDCFRESNEKDMVIFPANKIKYRPQYILKPRLRLR